jgi:hypothetical protein
MTTIAKPPAPKTTSTTVATTRPANTAQTAAAAPSKPASKTNTDPAAPGYPAGSIRSQTSTANGAFFFKVASPDVNGNRGITAVGTLPQVTFDPTRQHVQGLPANVAAAAKKAGPPSSNAAYYGSVYQAGKVDAGTAQATLTALVNSKTGPLDRPSVYMGGHSKNPSLEVDTGLSTDRVYDGRGNATFTDATHMMGGPPARVIGVGGSAGARFVYDARDPNNMPPNKPTPLKGADGKAISGDAAVLGYLEQNRMVPNFGFRPFYRVSPQQPGQESWNTPQHLPPNNSNNQYFYPGENINMSVSRGHNGPNHENMQMSVSTTTEPARSSSFSFAANGVKTTKGKDGKDVPVFDRPGFSDANPISFKRVNSIDLFRVNAAGERVGLERKKGEKLGSDNKANEGLTRTVAANAVWQSTQVIGPKGQLTSLVGGGTPAALVRGVEWTDDLAAFRRIFQASWKNGAETITIDPTGRKP